MKPLSRLSILTIAVAAGLIATATLALNRLGPTHAPAGTPSFQAPEAAASRNPRPADTPTETSPVAAHLVSAPEPPPFWESAVFTDPAVPRQPSAAVIRSMTGPPGNPISRGIGSGHSESFPPTGAPASDQSLAANFGTNRTSNSPTTGFAGGSRAISPLPPAGLLADGSTADTLAGSGNARFSPSADGSETSSNPDDSGVPTASLAAPAAEDSESETVIPLEGSNPDASADPRGSHAANPDRNPDDTATAAAPTESNHSSTVAESVQQLADGPATAEAIRQLNDRVITWFAQDPDAALAWLNQTKRYDDLSSSVSSIAVSMANGGEIESAIQWLETVPDPSIQSDAIVDLYALAYRNGKIQRHGLSSKGLTPEEIARVLRYD